MMDIHELEREVRDLRRIVEEMQDEFKDIQKLNDLGSKQTPFEDIYVKGRKSQQVGRIYWDESAGAIASEEAP